MVVTASSMDIKDERINSAYKRAEPPAKASYMVNYLSTLMKKVYYTRICEDVIFLTTTQRDTSAYRYMQKCTRKYCAFPQRNSNELAEYEISSNKLELKPTSATNFTRLKFC
ncbi:hypothetical protein EVAR_49421_1 [Eumeta japonica]|uniref:Uncharacterized protein n=1 Tax=Eumeta variegata TaxID=151549 RepID=A0A4C1YXS8_EUMVA|nr:hypothetical protein EVAR_49421_1 [Eumeta japonica]